MSPRHYPAKDPFRRQLLECQLLDLEQLLNSEGVSYWHHDTVLFEPFPPRSLAQEVKRPKNQIPMTTEKQIQSLELLRNWVRDELEATP